jgi:hypothetical protein
MTWNQQIRGLRRALGSKMKNPAALERKRARQKAAKEPRPDTVVVHGTVKQEFLDRMRAMGVRVEVKP